MNTSKIVGIILIVLGAAGLAYGGFSFTQDSQKAKIGSLELTVAETRTVNVPVWLGAGLVVVGVVLLLGIGRKS